MKPIFGRFKPQLKFIKFGHREKKYIKLSNLTLGRPTSLKNKSDFYKNLDLPIKFKTVN